MSQILEQWVGPILPYAKPLAIGGIVLMTLGSMPRILRFLQKYNKRKPPFKRDWERGVIYLYNWPRSRAVPSLSPFAMKLETWFRMADMRYENVDIPILVMSKEGMRPFVELDGVEYADSGLIMQELKVNLAERIEKGKLEAHLSEEEKATGRAMERMAEMSIWWVYAWVRYVENCHVFLKEVFDCFPMSLFERSFFTLGAKYLGFLRKGMKSTVIATGLGRHSREDMMKIGLTDVRALSQYLGEKPYFMGDRLTKVDAAVFGLFSQILYFTVDSELKQLSLSDECANLKAHGDRIRERYWPDWEESAETLSLHTDWRSTVYPEQTQKEN